MVKVKTSILMPVVRQVLNQLHNDARANDPRVFETVSRQGLKQGTQEYYQAMREAYLPVDPQFGNLLYSMARALRAKTIVEFGTSFGISTIYLASALKDEGSGKLITTEFVPEKAERARKNLSDAELESFVEFRVGDALQTLKESLPQTVDFLFLDGPKNLYLDVLKLIEPRLRAGTLIVSDNTDQPDLASFLEYLRTPSHGYLSSALLTESHGRQTGHEVTLRIG